MICHANSFLTNLEINIKYDTLEVKKNKGKYENVPVVLECVDHFSTHLHLELRNVQCSKVFLLILNLTWIEYACVWEWVSFRWVYKNLNGIKMFNFPSCVCFCSNIDFIMHCHRKK